MAAVSLDAGMLPEAGIVRIGAATTVDDRRAAAPPRLIAEVEAEPQRAIPAIARQQDDIKDIIRAIRALETQHILYRHDSRSIDLTPESVHLVVTSPPYWTLKKYNDHEGQLAGR